RIQEIQFSLEQWEKKWNYEFASWQKRFLLFRKENTSEITPILDFLEWNEKRMQEWKKTSYDLQRFLVEQNRIYAKRSHALIEEAKKLLLVPASNFLGSFPIMIRKMAKELGKEVSFEMEGENISLDKRILETLQDPLIHLLRNALDHGIETAEERKAMGKPPQGLIRLTIEEGENQRILIRLADDGRGLNRKKILEKAYSMNLISSKEGENLSDEEVWKLIFHSGVSTKSQLSALSGRGLGMAIVAQQVEALGGTITIESRENQGTTFSLLLPLTLATFRGILVKSSQRYFVVPLQSVERVMIVSREQIGSIENQKAISYQGKPLGLLSLASLLSLPEFSTHRKKIFLLILHYRERRMALMVDEILEEREILIKPLGPFLEGASFFQGVTSLTTGELVPILKIAGIFQAVANLSQPLDLSLNLDDEEIEKKKILVAEDTLTSRLMLKSILEHHGFEVITAIDGQEGWEKLLQTPVDLVVTDVEMPQMNGFELTQKIKSHYPQLPVILVTSLEKEEDRKKGLEAGANAYIVKSGFDQKELVERINQFLL
ncbi:MAG: hybrid sensor histidine kinase/response regulator, partial [Planctomycetota bacterium]